jgi:hypothetical protein
VGQFLGLVGVGQLLPRRADGLQVGAKLLRQVSPHSTGIKRLATADGPAAVGGVGGRDGPAADLRGRPVTSVPAQAPQGGRLVRLAHRVEGGLESAKGGLRRCRAWAGDRCRDLGRLWRNGRERAAQLRQALLLAWALVWAFRWHVLIATAVGLLLGLVAWLGSPVVGVAAGALGAFALTLVAVIVALPLPAKRPGLGGPTDDRPGTPDGRPEADGVG